MARDEGFLRRWSRRKQAAKAAETAEVQPPAALAPVQAVEPAAEPVLGPNGALAVGPGAAPEAAALEAAAPELDLPPLETLGAASDFTAFLQKGVSAELQSRALRVAWESDGVIAGFRGMAEYAWDFNAPGYGKLWAADDVVKMVGEALRGAVPEAEEPPPEGPVEERPAVVAEAPAAAEQGPADPVPAAGDPAPPEAVAVASPEEAPDGFESELDPVPRNAGPRRHGGALPA